ncbi:hypothetical protein T492DRAFT_842980 [Pavlovales sp. CCMP2436]|nr:hypothetical protein T492DRAFT_842980 [Pavlovales sp. CCMP2436]
MAWGLLPLGAGGGRMLALAPSLGRGCFDGAAAFSTNCVLDDGHGGLIRSILGFVSCTKALHAQWRALLDRDASAEADELWRASVLSAPTAHLTLAEAVRRVRPGDRIRVPPGEHHFLTVHCPFPICLEGTPPQPRPSLAEYSASSTATLPAAPVSAAAVCATPVCAAPVSAAPVCAAAVCATPVCADETPRAFLSVLLGALVMQCGAGHAAVLKELELRHYLETALTLTGDGDFKMERVAIRSTRAHTGARASSAVVVRGGARLVLRHSVVEDCTAALVLCAADAHVEARACAFRRNRVIVNAGRGGLVTLSGCTLSGNDHVSRASANVVVRLDGEEADEPGVQVQG